MMSRVVSRGGRSGIGVRVPRYRERALIFSTRDQKKRNDTKPNQTKPSTGRAGRRARRRARGGGGVVLVRLILSFAVRGF